MMNSYQTTGTRKAVESLRRARSKSCFFSFSYRVACIELFLGLEVRAVWKLVHLTCAVAGIPCLPPRRPHTVGRLTLML